MISVYFNTTLDGYYQVTVIIFFFAGKRIVSSDILLTPKALAWGFNLRLFPFDPKFLIASSKVHGLCQFRPNKKFKLI